MSLLAATRPTTGHVPGRRVVLLGVVGVLGLLGLDLLLGPTVGLFFDLCFIVLCLGLAVLVDRADVFVVGVLPPLLLVGAFSLVAALAPGALARPDDGAVQALVTGVLHHAVGLGVGYALCLATLAARMTGD
ncbi:DUF6542 domain-containing protein [Nocardioides sp. CPCC 205120]|uniref:DUF6542 domain-containing protein n=1 Tax=Nocardioides sp. CPCC 205120 TaxID=3406462 RepID=UPI003B514D07